jgi:hypothetical protein
MTIINKPAQAGGLGTVGVTGLGGPSDTSMITQPAHEVNITTPQTPAFRQGWIAR